MSNRRLLKAAEAIREVVATSILMELQDPRVKDVTVISVEVTPDMREAKVQVSIMGSEKQKNQCMTGLRNSAGFLQSRISDRIDARYTPKLRFELNKGADNAMLVTELLAKIKSEKETQESGKASDAPQTGHTEQDPPSGDEVSQSAPAVETQEDTNPD